MKGACPYKWSQSGEMSSEDTAAHLLTPAKPYCCLSLTHPEPSSPIPAKDGKAGKFTAQIIPPLPLLGKTTQAAKTWRKGEEESFFFPPSPLQDWGLNPEPQIF